MTPDCLLTSAYCHFERLLLVHFYKYRKREIHQRLALISCIGNTSDSRVDFSTRQYGSHFMFDIKAGLEMTVQVFQN